MIPKEKYKDILGLFAKKYCELDQLQRQYEAGNELSPEAFRTLTPTRIFFEPTNNCNLNCVYCARSKMVRKISNLSLKAFQNGIQSIPKGTYLIMVGNGEPLLNNQVYDMISHAVEAGLLVGVITNATALTEKNARRLLKTGAHRVQISFDTIEKPLFNKLQSNLNDFDKTLYNILRFVYLARQELRIPVFITISAVMTRENTHSFARTREFWQSLPVDNLYEGPLLSLQTDSGTYAEAQADLTESYKICANPWTSLKINADGSVNPCALDFSSKYVIGNIHENDLATIANSEPALLLRKALYDRDISFFEKIGYNCHRCNAWTEPVAADIGRYLLDGLPITYGLMINEIANRASYEPHKIERLARIIENYDTFLKDLERDAA